MADQFDLVVIGGGNGGYIPAIRASQLGMSVALIEKREGGHLGGTCLNVGCIPTKALLQTAHLLHDARNGEDFGVKVGEVEFDYPQAAKRRDQVVGQLRKGVQGLMKKNKITVYNGTGSFIEPKKIKVEGNDGLTFGSSTAGKRAKDIEPDTPQWTEMKTKAGKERKRLPLACIACRRKKIRCSGEKPACKHCVRSRIPCVYKVTTRKAAPRTDYMAMLDKRLKRMEDRVIKLIPKESLPSVARRWCSPRAL